MSEFRFTIKFAGSESSNFRKNGGLRLDQISKLLNSLYEVLGVDDSNRLTLKEIKHQSQAFVFSTPEKITYQKLQIVHANIDKVDLETISSKELAYARTLKEIKNADDIELEAFSDDRSFYLKYSDFNIPEKEIRYYFDVRVVYGKIAQIGNVKIDQDTYIWIDIGAKESIRVKLTKEQDLALKDFYRDKKIKFKVKFRKKIEDKSISGSAELIDFEPVDSTSIAASMKKFRDEFGGELRRDIDTDEYLRKLRGNN